MARPSGIVKIVNSLQWVNILIYGDPGIGKTPLAATSQKALFLEADDGEASAAVWGTTADMKKVRDWDEINEMYEWLKHEGHKEYDWVWIDSGTLFQESGLINIMDDLVAQRPHRNRYVPDRGEYGENMTRMKELVRNFKALPMNFGLTALVMRVEDRDGEVQYMPAFQGKDMPQKITSYMDVVGYLDRMRPETPENANRRALRLENFSKYYTRDRFHCTEKGTLVDPTIPKLMALIDKKRKASATNVVPIKKAAAPVKKAASVKKG